jgi:EAL domain-containing protein (putative c-di-GMP-specific phosphodiesterase class I)
MLQSHDLPGSALVVEFSEAALLQASATQRAQLAALRQSGIQLCLTGVGAPGASALTALYHPLDEYRLAPAIVDRAAREALAHQALQKTMEMTRMLKLRVVFSAVDSPQQRQLAETLVGDYAEGLGYRAALTPQAVERWLHPRGTA